MVIVDASSAAGLRVLCWQSEVPSSINQDARMDCNAEACSIKMLHASAADMETERLHATHGPDLGIRTEEWVIVRKLRHDTPHTP